MRLAVLLAGCGAAAHEPPANSVGKPPEAPPALSCSLVLHDLALDFELVNGTDLPRTLTYFAPVIPQNVVVTAAGARRSVAQPQLDLPVQRQELRIEPHGKAFLASPIRLRFEYDRPGKNGFTWTIQGPRATVDITAELVFDDGKTKLTCGARWSQVAP